MPTGQVVDYSSYLVGDDKIEDLGINLTFNYTYTSSETGNTITLSYNKNYDCSGTYTIHVSASFTNDNYTNKGATNVTGTLTIKKVDVYLDVVGFAKEPGVNDEDQQTASPINVDRNSSSSQSLWTNQIIKGLIVKVDDKEDTSLVATAYSDDALTQAIDFKDINSWNDVRFWIVVKKGDKTIFVSEYNAYSVNFITTYYVNEYYSEYVTISDKLVTYTLTEAGNFEFIMPDALNGATLTQYYKTGDGSYAEGPIAVVSGVNNIDYKLEIKIGDVTYTYETDLQVIVSASAQSVLSENAGYSATFGSMNVNDNEVETSSENYNVSNIKSLKESIDKKETTLNYDESKYDLTNQTSEIVGNTLLVTIVLTEKDTTDPGEEGESEFSSGVELYAGETKTVTIILVIKFSGWVDNDTGAVINYRNEKDESKQTIGNEITTTADVNNFRIELNNHYATWKLEAEGEDKTIINKEDVSENGELQGHWSPEAGSTWKLTITATDGTTTRTITINVVEAEQTPDIKLTIDDDAQTTLCVYGFEDGEPTGDFVVSQVLDEANFKNIARFYAYLGSDYLKADQTTITISSLEFNEDSDFYEIIASLIYLEFTWKGTNGEDLDSEDFTLTINKTDPDAPYAKFYIGGKFDMSEMGGMSEYDATAEEITPEEGSGEQSFEGELLIEFYIYFCENANELEDLPDDDTSIIVQMYGASITKSNFKYNKVSNTYVGTFKNLWLYQIGESIKIERLKTSLGTADISKSFAREETPWGVGVKIKLTATTDTYIVLLFLDSNKSELDDYETKFGKLSETTFSVTIDGKTATQDNIDYRAKKGDGPTKIFIKINKKYEDLINKKYTGEHGIKIDDISFGGKYYNDGNWFLLACYSENGTDGYAINKYVKISDMGDDKWLSVYNYSHGEAAVFFIATTKDYLEENGFNENMFHSTNDTDYRWVYEICVVFSDSKGEGLEEPVHVFESEFAGEDAEGNAETLRLNFKAESLTDSVTANGSAYVIQNNYCIVATVGENNEFKFTTVDGNEYITMTSFTPKTELIVFGNSEKKVIFSGSASNCAIAYDNGYKLKVLTYTYYDNGEEKTVKYVEFYVYLSDGYNFYGYEDGYLPCYIIFAEEIPQGLFLTEDDYYKVTFNDSVSSFVTLKDADIVSQLTGGDYSTLVMGNIYNKGTVTNSITDGKERIDVVVKYTVTVQDLETLRETSTYSLNINVSNRLLIFGKVTLTDGGNSSNKTTITNAGQYSVTLKMQTTDTECFVSFTLTHGGDTYTFKCLFEVPSASETE